jgi:hypothetical protein
LYGLTNERSEFIFALMPVDELLALQRETVFPQFAVGGGWGSDFFLVNPTDAPITGVLRFSSTVSLDGQNGSNFPYLIPGKSSRRFLASSAATQATVGLVRVIPAASDPVPTGTALLRFMKGGVTVSSSVVRADSGRTAARTFVESGKSVRSGLAIANTDQARASVSLTLIPLDGSPPRTAIISVPGNGQQSLFLDDITEFRNLPAIECHMDIMSSTPIAGAATRVRTNERGDPLTTSVTPADRSVIASSPELLFPFFAAGDGYETQFVIFNRRGIGMQSGAIQFIDKGGQPRTLTLR